MLVVDVVSKGELFVGNFVTVPVVGQLSVLCGVKERERGIEGKRGRERERE
jgi:hypothetical protein